MRQQISFIANNFILLHTKRLVSSREERLNLLSSTIFSVLSNYQNKKTASFIESILER